MADARDILARNRREALAFAQRAGSDRLSGVLGAAEKELIARLGNVRAGLATFTRANLESALVQVRAVLGGVNAGMSDVLTSNAGSAAELGANGTIDYLRRLDRQFRGTGTMALNLDTAAMFERATVGARASVLRRLVSSGTGAPGAPQAASPAKPGILARYGVGVIGDFEKEMQVGLLARSSWEDVKAKLVAKSPFLQGKPAFWAERIVRTESMAALGRGAWEANREADDQLGDVVKVLAATFDDRTGADSYAVHGQIRRPDEAFESWFGLYQHPPNRPNDREVVVPHRLSWPVPPYLVPKTDAEVAKRWEQEKRKGATPPRPIMSTVTKGLMGKKPPSVRETEARGERKSMAEVEGE